MLAWARCCWWPWPRVRYYPGLVENRGGGLGGWGAREIHGRPALPPSVPQQQQQVACVDLAALRARACAHAFTSCTPPPPPPSSALPLPAALAALARPHAPLPFTPPRRLLHGRVAAQPGARAGQHAGVPLQRLVGLVLPDGLPGRRGRRGRLGVARARPGLLHGRWVHPATSGRRQRAARTWHSVSSACMYVVPGGLGVPHFVEEAQHVAPRPTSPGAAGPAVVAGALGRTAWPPLWGAAVVA